MHDIDTLVILSDYLFVYTLGLNYLARVTKVIKFSVRSKVYCYRKIFANFENIKTSPWSANTK